MTEPNQPDPVPAEPPAAAGAALHPAPADLPGVPASAPEPAPEPARPSPPVRPAPRSPVAVLGGIGFLLIIVALVYLYAQLQAVVVPPFADPARVTALETQLRALQQRVSQLEQRPAAAAPASVDLRPLEARMAALEQRPPPPPAAPGVAPAEVAALQQRLAADEAQTKALADRAARAARLAAAQIALESGQSLGDVPGAPAPLARFATEKPPTEAALRLAYPAAADRAAEASRPGTDGLSVADRMWQRVESVVTVRDGDKVIVGAPAAVVLAAAQAKLNAGDLAGCVAALNGLDAAAAAAMAAWRAQAQALLDARAALAALARG